MKAFFASAWDWSKRIFGRSRTIFVNVIGVLSIVYVEMSDYLISFNWDDFFKHEVSVVIGLVVNVLNVIIRMDTSGPVSFKKLPDVPEVPDLPDEEAPQSPKAV